MREYCSYTYPPLSIASIQLSELEQCRVKKLAQGFNTTAQDSNPGSHSRESKAVPLSHCALTSASSSRVCGCRSSGMRAVRWCLSTFKLQTWQCNSTRASLSTTTTAGETLLHPEAISSLVFRLYDMSIMQPIYLFQIYRKIKSRIFTDTVNKGNCM